MSSLCCFTSCEYDTSPPTFLRPRSAALRSLSCALHLSSSAGLACMDLAGIGLRGFQNLSAKLFIFFLRFISSPLLTEFAFECFRKVRLIPSNKNVRTNTFFVLFFGFLFYSLFVYLIFSFGDFVFFCSSIVDFCVQSCFVFIRAVASVHKQEGVSTYSRAHCSSTYATDGLSILSVLSRDK